LEALMVHLLIPKPGDIVLYEIEVSLVSLDGVAQVILIDLLLVVTEEGTDRFYARSTLEILACKQLIEMLLETRSASIGTYLKHLQDSDEHLLETFKVPILADDSVDNKGKEYLVSFLH